MMLQEELGSLMPCSQCCEAQIKQEPLMNKVGQCDRCFLDFLEGLKGKGRRRNSVDLCFQRKIC